MPRLQFCSLISLLVFASAPLHAGTLSTIGTPFNADDSQDGNMFDVTVTSAEPLLVTRLALNLVNGFSGSVSIYEKSGTWVGFDATPAAWTLIDTVSTVTSAGFDQQTWIDPSDFLLPANSTTALYITDTSDFAFQYTTGGTVGGVAASNADLKILTGAGESYLFAQTFAPRTWNGVIEYQVEGGLTSTPEPASMSLMLIGGIALICRRRRSN